ncbi:MAG: hypothetical protein ACYSVY_25225, partial [Planctomycetota bacterium]
QELTEHTIDYRICFTGDADPLREKIEALGGKLDGHTITLPGHDLDKVNQAVDLLRSNHLTLESVEPHRFSLEDVLVEAMAAQ